MTREDLTEREHYVITRILDCERYGLRWATLARLVDQAAAARLAKLGFVELGEDGRDFIVRRANGVRIEDLA